MDAERCTLMSGWSTACCMKDHIFPMSASESVVRRRSAIHSLPQSSTVSIVASIIMSSLLLLLVGVLAATCLWWRHKTTTTSRRSGHSTQSPEENNLERDVIESGSSFPLPQSSVGDLTDIVHYNEETTGAEDANAGKNPRK